LRNSLYNCSLQNTTRRPRFLSKDKVASRMGEQEPETTFARIQRLIKENIKKFSKTPYAIPAAILLTAGFYYLVVTLLAGTCLMNFLPPLFMLWVFWTLDVKNAKKLIIFGLVGAVVCGAVQTAVYIDYFTSLEIVPAESEDGRLTGSVSPATGDTSITYTFTAVVHANLTATTIEPVNLTLVGYTGNIFTSYDLQLDNYTMTLLFSNDTHAVYTAQTTVSRAINYYYFSTNLTTDSGTDYIATGSTGPISDNTGAMVGPMVLTAYLIILAQFIPIYSIVVFMIWWTRRARQYREKAISKWEIERKKTDEDISKGSKGDRKAADLRKAMGLDEKSKDSFVCSECGADVPADATECPKCGEKFEGEKDEEQKEEAKATTPAKPKGAETSDTFVCSECGADVPADATKCPKCGDKFD